jgi:hypothetical protein
MYIWIIITVQKNCYLLKVLHYVLFHGLILLSFVFSIFNFLQKCWIIKGSKFTLHLELNVNSETKCTVLSYRKHTNWNKRWTVEIMDYFTWHSSSEFKVGTLKIKMSFIVLIVHNLPSHNRQQYLSKESESVQFMHECIHCHT